MTHPFLADDTTSRPSYLSAVSCWLTILAGITVLFGWWCDLDLLKSMARGFVAMNPVTAIAFILCGVALLCLRRNAAACKLKRWGQAGAAVVAAIGALVLGDYIFDRAVGIDLCLFADRLDGNRMAPNTAVNFLLLGIALVLLDAKTKRGFWPSQVLLLLVAASSLFSLVGYGYGAKALYGLTFYIPMALNTAALFAVLSLGVLYARPEHGAMAVLLADKAGGIVARRLVPAVIGLPCLLGWLRVAGQTAGLYDTEFGAALMVALNVSLSLAIVLWIGNALNRADDNRRQAEAELRAAHDELEARVQQRTAELASVNDALQDELREHERAEAALRDSEERFRLLVDSVKDYAILMLDPKGRVASWNAGAERIKGYRADEIIGSHISRFYTADERNKAEIELSTAINEGRYEEEGLRVRKDGSQFWANVVITPIRDRDGLLHGFSKVTRDITERRQAAQQLQALHDELEEHVVQLEEANKELAQKNQENEMFVYSVSHDLRSPLVNLQGFSKELGSLCGDLRNLLGEENVPASVQKHGLQLVDGDIQHAIRFIQSGVMRLSTIIDALLRLSRAGRVEYQQQQLDMQSIVSRIVESVSGTAFDRGAEIAIGDLPTAWGDAAAIEQVFANLIQNALNYLDPARPGHIEIGYDGCTEGPHEGFATYYVQDNGLGIPEAYISKVFQVFKRFHGDVAKGEGIGLAIVRRVVERHGGKVWVESQPGVGSRFFVSLPSPASDNCVNQQMEQDRLERSAT